VQRVPLLDQLPALPVDAVVAPAQDPEPTASATTVARVRLGGTTLLIELDVSTRTSSRLGRWAASCAA
jgi:hypothetical protein